MWNKLLLALLLASSAHYQTVTLTDVRPRVDKSIVGSNGSVVTVEHDMYDITIRIDDLDITGEDEKRWKWSYDPADLVIGKPLSVRIESKDFFIKREQGKDIKVHIVRRKALSTATASGTLPTR